MARKIRSESVWLRCSYHDRPRASKRRDMEALMIRSFLTVSTGTLASRLLGFARDSMIAALLGTGPVADAFLVAFQLVNVVRRLLSEGALNAALVPAWLRIREAEGAVAAAAFAGRVLGTVSAALIVATALIGLLMPFVMTVLAPGFAGQATLQLAVDDARLMLPYLAFAGPVTVMMALLNAQARFALTAFSPLLFNIAFDAEMRGFLGTASPGMIASSGPQLLVVGGAIIASSSPSAVSWLYFANRLIELPLGMVGAAMGAVLVPELTRAVRSRDRTAMTRAESRGLELAAGLALPATLGLIVLSEPIARMLFEHGAFAAADTVATTRALMLLALGLPAHVLVKALSPAFFARGDTRTPLLATLEGFAVAIVLAVVLGRFFGTDGIAISIALGAWSSAVGLIRRGAATFGFSVDAAARRRLPRIVMAALTMGGLLWLMGTYLPAPAAGAHSIAQAVVLGLLIAGGMAIYGLLLALFGVITWADAVSAVRQTTAPDLRD